MSQEEPSKIVLNQVGRSEDPSPPFSPSVSAIPYKDITHDMAFSEQPSSKPQAVTEINKASFDEPAIVEKPKFNFVNPLKTAEYLPYFRVDVPLVNNENQMM